MIQTVMICFILGTCFPLEVGRLAYAGKRTETKIFSPSTIMSKRSDMFIRSIKIKNIRAKYAGMRLDLALRIILDERYGRKGWEEKTASMKIEFYGLFQIEDGLIDCIMGRLVPCNEDYSN